MREEFFRAMRDIASFSICLRLTKILLRNSSDKPGVGGKVIIAKSLEGKTHERFIFSRCTC